MSVNMFCLSSCGPVMDWRPVQGVPCPSPSDSWDRLQFPRDPKLDEAVIGNGWMELQVDIWGLSVKNFIHIVYTELTEPLNPTFILFGITDNSVVVSSCVDAENLQSAMEAGLIKSSIAFTACVRLSKRAAPSFSFLLTCVLLYTRSLLLWICSDTCGIEINTTSSPSCYHQSVVN